MTRSKKPHLTALTGLRFIAALNIVVFHFGQAHLAAAPEWLRHAVSRGFDSVGLFFVLSGFVLAYAYLDGASDLGIDRRRFWIARLARTYPVYLLASLLGATLTVYELAQVSPRAVVLDHAIKVAAITLPALQAWVPWAENWNFPAWALSVEAFFYVVFPFFAIWLGRLDRRRLVIALGVLFALGRLAPLAQAQLGWLLGPHALGLVAQDQEWRLDSNPLLNLPTFLVGVVLGRLFALHLKDEGFSGWKPRLLGLTASCIGALATVATLAGYPAGVPVDALFVPAFALLVYGLAYGSGPIAWILSRPAVLILGEASYGIYILQLPVWQWISAVDQTFPFADPSSGVFFLLYVVALVACSVAVLYLVERPARSLISRTGGAGPRGGPCLGPIRPSAVSQGAGDVVQRPPVQYLRRLGQ